ncbi:hypothetical protein Q4543_19435 [Salipiger sp. 1_MG-2023]|uniref:hypothetical protein n=1 Tax=Salipiger sp. 1_MG-2023 TaxID=3062665 RepID=UPI0026E21B17|nr:hypothetical protein [Salipiger sp. 1_MG-2023]MDO6587688.1 hypothetical protein [Salipiger sp. 1_MG-2023]
MDWTNILAAFEPYLTELIAAALSGLLYQLLKGVVERATLHSAIKTGVGKAIAMLADGKITKEELIDFALSYARTSSPGAVKGRKATTEIMEGIAMSKLSEFPTSLLPLALPGASPKAGSSQDQ